VSVTGYFLRIKQPTGCIKYPKLYFVIKLYVFRASSVPIIRSFLVYTRQLVCFMQVMWPLPSRFRLEQSSNLNLLESSHITCMKHTNCRVCAVDNPWWWAQKMPATRRVLWQNKFWIFDASSWLFYTKLITMRGHLKYGYFQHSTRAVSLAFVPTHVPLVDPGSGMLH
jgi:hypothetical protein